MKQLIAKNSSPTQEEYERHEARVILDSLDRSNPLFEQYIKDRDHLNFCLYKAEISPGDSRDFLVLSSSIKTNQNGKKELDGFIRFFEISKLLDGIVEPYLEGAVSFVSMFMVPDVNGNLHLGFTRKTTIVDGNAVLAKSEANYDVCEVDLSQDKFRTIGGKAGAIGDKIDLFTGVVVEQVGERVFAAYTVKPGEENPSDSPNGTLILFEFKAEVISGMPFPISGVRSIQCPIDTSEVTTERIDPILFNMGSVLRVLVLFKDSGTGSSGPSLFRWDVNQPTLTTATSKLTKWIYNYRGLFSSGRYVKSGRPAVFSTEESNGLVCWVFGANVFYSQTIKLSKVEQASGSDFLRRDMTVPDLNLKYVKRVSKVAADEFSISGNEVGGEFFIDIRNGDLFQYSPTHGDEKFENIFSSLDYSKITSVTGCGDDVVIATVDDEERTYLNIYSMSEEKVRKIEPLQGKFTADAVCKVISFRDLVVVWIDNRDDAIVINPKNGEVVEHSRRIPTVIEGQSFEFSEAFVGNKIYRGANKEALYSSLYFAMVIASGGLTTGSTSLSSANSNLYKNGIIDSTLVYSDEIKSLVVVGGRINDTELLSDFIFLTPSPDGSTSNNSYGYKVMPFGIAKPCCFINGNLLIVTGGEREVSNTDDLLFLLEGPEIKFIGFKPSSTDRRIGAYGLTAGGRNLILGGRKISNDGTPGEIETDLKDIGGYRVTRKLGSFNHEPMFDYSKFPRIKCDTRSSIPAASYIVTSKGQVKTHVRAYWTGVAYTSTVKIEVLTEGMAAKTIDVPREISGFKAPGTMIAISGFLDSNTNVYFCAVGIKDTPDGLLQTSFSYHLGDGTVSASTTMSPKRDVPFIQNIVIRNNTDLQYVSPWLPDPNDPWRFEDGVLVGKAINNNLVLSKSAYSGSWKVDRYFETSEGFDYIDIASPSAVGDSFYNYSKTYQESALLLSRSSSMSGRTMFMGLEVAKQKIGYVNRVSELRPMSLVSFEGCYYAVAKLGSQTTPVPPIYLVRYRLDISWNNWVEEVVCLLHPGGVYLGFDLLVEEENGVDGLSFYYVEEDFTVISRAASFRNVYLKGTEKIFKARFFPEKYTITDHATPQKTSSDGYLNGIPFRSLNNDFSVSDGRKVYYLNRKRSTLAAEGTESLMAYNLATGHWKNTEVSRHGLIAGMAFVDSLLSAPTMRETTAGVIILHEELRSAPAGSTWYSTSSLRINEDGSLISHRYSSSSNPDSGKILLPKMEAVNAVVYGNNNLNVIGRSSENKLILNSLEISTAGYLTSGKRPAVVPDITLPSGVDAYLGGVHHNGNLVITLGNAGLLIYKAEDLMVPVEVNIDKGVKMLASYSGRLFGFYIDGSGLCEINLQTGTTTLISELGTEESAIVGKHNLLSTFYGLVFSKGGKGELDVFIPSKSLISLDAISFNKSVE